MNQLFKDKKGQTIYYVSREKRAYEIKEEKVRLIDVLHSRLIVSLFVGVVLNYFGVDTIIVVSLIIVLYVGMTYWLKVKILPVLTPIENYDVRENTQKFHNEAEISKSLRGSYIQLILSTLFVVISVYAYFTNEFDHLQVLLFVAVGLSFVYTSTKNIIYFQNARRNLDDSKKRLK